MWGESAGDKWSVGSMVKLSYELIMTESGRTSLGSSPFSSTNTLTNLSKIGGKGGTRPRLPGRARLKSKNPPYLYVSTQSGVEDEKKS